MEATTLSRLWHTRKYTEHILKRPGADVCRPKKALETIKGISEQKATKILAEGVYVLNGSITNY